MSKHIEDLYNAKQIAEVDLVVCGAGPAGVGAALRAARNGVKVMIVESLGCLGGVATAGMMSNWGGNSSSKILLEIYERSYEIDKGYTWNYNVYIEEKNNPGRYIPVEEVVEKIREITPEDLSAMGRASLETIQPYTIENMAKVHVEIFDRQE